MSERGSMKAKLAGLIALVATVVVIVWFVNRPAPIATNDEIEAKANMLTRQAVEAEDQRTAEAVQLPDESFDGLKDMRADD